MQLMAPTLEDTRAREALKFGGAFAVNVCDCHRVFFSAYDPDTSLYRAAASACRRSACAGAEQHRVERVRREGRPSTTRLYHRLVELLTEKHKIRNAGQSAVRKQMVCRRRLTLLLRETG